MASGRFGAVAAKLAWLDHGAVAVSVGRPVVHIEGASFRIRRMIVRPIAMSGGR